MSRKRKHLDDELEPTAKLVSDGDLLIERLLEKQLSKHSSLQTELQRNQQFISSTEYKPLSDYVSGLNSSNELKRTSEYIQTLEEFTAAGLSREDVDLYMDREKGSEYFKLKHKNLDSQWIEKRLKTIDDVFKDYQNSKSLERSLNTGSRLQSECMLSIKPNSVQTNLLKFALSNEKINEPADNKIEQMKLIEKDLMNAVNDGLNQNVNLTKLQKKVQRRLRVMSNRIDAIVLPTERNEIKTSNSCTVNGSKWDLKYDESNTMSCEQNISESNILQAPTWGKFGDTEITSKNETSGNRYTIRDGIIVKLENLIDFTSCEKLSLEELINIPKFSQYEPGKPSKILYLKNTHSLSETDLKLMFKAFNFQTKSIKTMKGKMKGQAFVEMDNCELAEQALTCINGIVVKDRPIIIQFSTKNEIL